MKLTIILLSIIAVTIPIAMAHAQEAIDYQDAPGTPATEARAEWYKITEGTDLARGKKVLFSPTPNDALTTDENDPYDLTDGKLSMREDDRVWFQKDAVGWYGGVGTNTGVFMLIDLGSEQPVGQIAVRALGGHEQSSLDLPKEFDFLASVDGQQYYQLQKTVKLNEAEKNQSDGKTGFYISEVGHAFMAPFVCRVPVMARYIALHITPTNSLFVDQISILKAMPSQKITELTSYPKKRVFTEGLAILPRHEPFTITTNIATPNWFVAFDSTHKDLEKTLASFRIDLPDGLDILDGSNPKFEEVPSSRKGMHAYEFPFTGKETYMGVPLIGPIWIVKKENATLPPQAKVLLTGIVDGKDSQQVEYPLTFVKVPEVEPIKGLDASLGWTPDSAQKTWPDFLRDYHKMGFNNLPTFPYYYTKDTDSSWSEYTKEILDNLDKARKQGYKILYNESPFHVMWQTIQSDLANGKIDDAEAEKLFTQIDGKRGKWMNLLYRGKYYQNEINRVAELSALVQPDQIFLDIEWWTESVEESRKDPRVIAAWKTSGKDWDDFVTDIGTKVLNQVVSAMREAVPQKKIVIGLYNSDPTNKIYNSVFQWDEIYPGIIDIAMPSLYVQGRTPLIADRIRYDYDQMQTKEIIPWLSTGTYGEFDPKLVEPMILESLLNGSRGITYFWFGDFDPMDYYYHTKAIQDLKPYENLLQNGKPIAYKGENPDMHYTAFSSDKEALVLVGNYSHSAQTKVLLPLPIQATKVLLGGETLPVENNTVIVNVPAREFKLIYFSR